MRTVMIFGTFDVVHQGHLHFFQQARKYGDYLVAVVARDARAEKIKNKKLLHTEKERKFFLEAIKYIDKVILGDKKDVYAVIHKIKPDCIVLGYDQKHFTEKLQEKIEEFGLHTTVKRSKPYKQNTFKTTHIRTQLEKGM